MSLNLCLLESCLENLSLSLCLSLYVCFMIVCSDCLCLCLLYVAVPCKGLCFIELHRKHPMVGKGMGYFTETFNRVLQGMKPLTSKNTIDLDSKEYYNHHCLSTNIPRGEFILEDCLQPRFLLFSAKGTQYYSGSGAWNST